MRSNFRAQEPRCDLPLHSRGTDRTTTHVALPPTIALVAEFQSMSSSLASVELAWLREENARQREENGRLREHNAQLLRQKGTSAALQAANQTELTHRTISNATQNDTEGNVASRTRRQTRMRGRDDEGDEKHHAAHVSPAMHIYRHALEAIFAMLELEDLIQIVAVSRAWSAAVRSMKPINASIERAEFGMSRKKCKTFRPLPPIARILVSPLLRHVSAIHIEHAGIRYTSARAWTPLTHASLGLLAQHAPSLTSLWCELKHMRTSIEPLVLPAKLTALNLQFDAKYTYAAINDVLPTVAALPSLSCLKLKLPTYNDKRPCSYASSRHVHH